MHLPTTVAAGLLFWLLAAVHVAGLASMFMARLPQSQRGHVLCHHGFVACLLFVGIATLVAILGQSAWWVWSGTTFAVMAVGATAEINQPAKSPVL